MPLSVVIAGHLDLEGRVRLDEIVIFHENSTIQVAPRRRP